MRKIDDVKPLRTRRNRRGNVIKNRRSVDAVVRLRKKVPGAPVTAKSRKKRGRAQIVSIDTGPKTTGLQIVRPHARLKSTLTTGLLITIAILGITILAKQPLGLVAVIGYGIFAVVRRISSRATFIIALVAIALVPATLLVFGGRNVVTSAFASYGFLLFAVGVITAWREASDRSVAN